MSQYSRDEFDKVPVSTTRQGVHRERLAPSRSAGIGLKIVVLALAVLVGAAALFLIPRLGIGPDAGSEAAASTSPKATASSVSQRATPTTPSATPTPTLTPTPTQTPEAAPTEAPVVAPDKTQPVNVLNSTGTAGLASTAASRLAADGWSGAQPGNWSGVPLPGSTVFFNGEEQRPSAEAIGAVLGIGALQNAPEVSAIVTVVLGPDFQ